MSALAIWRSSKRDARGFARMLSKPRALLLWLIRNPLKPADALNGASPLINVPSVRRPSVLCSGPT